MGEETKKISFGFSKLSKKTSIIPSKLVQIKPEETKVEFIDGFEGNSIKLKDPIKIEPKVLVIPLKTTHSTEATVRNIENIDQTTHENPSNSFANVPVSEQLPSEIVKGDSNLSSNVDIEGIILEQEKLTLDELAAKEILEELNKKKTESETQVFSVPLTSNAPTGEKESTLDDYENIPVGQFGMAMLRGMGWAPGKGIGKNEKLVTPSLPSLRPKGMGLGADKVIKVPSTDKETDEDLKMVVGSYVRVIAGPNKDCYGQIEGFDDESGRSIVKLALKNIVLSLNEFMIQLVNQKEFINNSKVLNVGKYEQYKGDEVKKESTGTQHSKKSIFVSRSSKSRSKSPKELKHSRSTSRYSRSPSSSRVSHSRHSSKNTKMTKSDKFERRPRNNSSSSDKSSSSSEYCKKSKPRTKKKKPSSHKSKSRSRSRSPRHKKHKKRR